MLTLLIFIAVLAVLVLSHEWGHFIAARKNKIGVEEFGFGFPPRIFGIRRIKSQKKWQFVWRNNDTYQGPDTLYSLNLIPLGGFVKIKGEDAGAAAANDPDSFAVKKAWQKAIVLIAGVGMNILVAWLLLSVAFMAGLPAAEGEGVPVHNAHLEVVQVLPGKPAEAAGIKAGDVITTVDTLSDPTVEAFQTYINDHRTSTVALELTRGDQHLTLHVQPTVYADTGKGGIGIAIARIGIVQYPWYQALYEGIKATGEDLWAIIIGFWTLFKNLFTGHGVGSDVSGPVGVAVLTGEAARLGFTYLLQFMALLSLNLAILNILPIPALDGGRLLFVIINKLSKKGVNAKTEQIIHTVAFLVLMLLVVLITVRDLGTFKDVIIGFFKRIV